MGGSLAGLEATFRAFANADTRFRVGEPGPCTYSRCIEDCRWNAGEREGRKGSMKGGLRCFAAVSEPFLVSTGK